MAGRRDRKDQLREQREQREAGAAARDRRRKLVGYAAGAAVAAIAIAAGVALLVGGDGTSTTASGDVLPDGGSYPAPDEDADLAAAARAAGCQLEQYVARSRRHIEPGEAVRYASDPPTSGPHHPPPAPADGAYEDPPDVTELVHALEHGRVIIWFDPELPAEQRASLKAYYDDDSYQLLLAPYESAMPYEVAATAWNRDPRPNGTGRLLGCPRYDDDVFAALEAFKDEHRGIGPEPVP